MTEFRLSERRKMGVQYLVHLILVTGLIAPPPAVANPAIVNGCDTTGSTYPAATGVAGFGGGTGVGGDPWLVCSRAQLSQVGTVGTAASGHYKLAIDIDLGGSSTPWTPINAAGFRGVVDGNYRTIRNLYVGGDRLQLGLFSNIGPTTGQPATVRRIKFVDPIIFSQSSASTSNNGKPAAGILAAQAQLADFTEILISNPSISGNLVSIGFVIGDGYYLAGTQNVSLVRISNGSMSSTATYAFRYMGGIVGLAGAGIIKRVSTHATFDGLAARTSFMGGIAGDVTRATAISEIHSLVDIRARGTGHYGGIIGASSSAQSSVNNSIYLGQITEAASGWGSGGLISASEIAPTFSIVASQLPSPPTNANHGPVLGSGAGESLSASSVIYDQTLNSQFGGQQYGTRKTTTELKTLGTYSAAGFSMREASSPDVTTTWELSDNTDPVWQITEGSYPTLIWMNYWPLVTVSAPSNVAVTSSSTNQASLSWASSLGSGFDSEITGYKVESSTDNGASWNTAIANTGSVSTSASVTGLLSGNSYVFRVSGLAGGTTSTPSASTAAIQTGSISSVPQNLEATRLSDNSYRVSWSPPSNTGGLAITGYTLQVDRGSGYETIAHSGTSADISGVSINSTWSFRVLATNSVGSSAYAVYTNTPPAPYSGPIITGFSNRNLEAQAPTTITLEGIRLNLVTELYITTNKLAFTKSPTDQLLVSLPALVPGAYDLRVIYLGGGVLTHQEAFFVKAVPPPITVSPPNQAAVKVLNFTNFAGDGYRLPAAASRSLTAAVRAETGVTKVVCTGSTSGRRASASDRRLATRRAQEACALVKRLAPAVEIEIKSNPASGQGARFRSVKVELFS